MPEHVLQIQGFPDLRLVTLAGEVIGREGGGWARAVTVNRGRGDGVESQTPVIVVDGLVGRVVRVRPGASVVQLLNDPSSSVGALVHRTRAVGLVEGAPAGGMRFKFMAREGAGIVPGDLIVTSGHGNVFPKGLPVGRVMAIEDRGSALFHYAILAPMADFARLEDVLLLTGKTTQAIKALYANAGPDWYIAVGEASAQEVNNRIDILQNLHSVCVPWQCGESTYTLQLQLAPPDTAPTKPPARNGAALAGTSAKKRGCGPGNSSVMARSTGAETSACQRRPQVANPGRARRGGRRFGTCGSIDASPLTGQEGVR